MKAILADRATSWLGRNQAECERVAYAGPWFWRHRWKKAAAAGVGAVANALEDVDAGVTNATPLALRGIDDRLTRLRLHDLAKEGAPDQRGPRHEQAQQRATVHG
jgi:hypothetical protein